VNKIDQLHEFLRENPKDAFLRYALALEYTRDKEFNLAIPIFEELIQNNPQYLATYYQFGQLLAALGQNVKAELILKNGIEIAKLQNNLKTCQELEQALFLLD
jgi:tetratricopeptide (TPR) repeat protein